MFELQEMRQKHASLCDQQEAIVAKAMTESRIMTEEEDTKYNSLQKEIKGMADLIQKAEAVGARAKELDKPAGKLIRIPGDIGVGAAEDKLDDGGFNNLGELLYAIKFGDTKGRLQAFSTSDAGIAIPPAFSQTIMSLNGEEEIVMPRAFNIPAGDPPDAPFSIPYLRQGNDGALGGITLTWTAEAQTIPDAGAPKIDDLTMTPREVSGLATINNKTLANWSAAGAFMQNLMRQAWVNGRDHKFLLGSGVGCPLGAYKSPGAIKVARDTSGTIKYIDTINMLARLYAGAGEAVYIANQTIMPTLMTLVDPGNHYIFNAGDATKGIPATLNGIKILWNGKTPLLGTEGDLVLAKLNYYLVKPGSGPFVAISEHVKFSTNQTVFRIVANIDGQLWVKDPLKLEDGATTVSPVVILKK